MNNVQREALEKVLAYLQDEREDYEASGKPDNHIYVYIAILEGYLEETRF